MLIGIRFHMLVVFKWNYINRRIVLKQIMIQPAATSSNSHRTDSHWYSRTFSLSTPSTMQMASPRARAMSSASRATTTCLRRTRTCGTSAACTHTSKRRPTWRVFRTRAKSMTSNFSWTPVSKTSFLCSEWRLELILKMFW